MAAKTRLIGWPCPLKWGSLAAFELAPRWEWNTKNAKITKDAKAFPSNLRRWPGLWSTAV